MADTEPNTVPTSKGRLLLIVAAFSLVAALGAGGWLYFRPSKQDSEKNGRDAKAHRVTTVLHLENFVVNLADPAENHFLRIGIDLGLENQAPGEEGQDEGGRVPLARVRDTILEVLTTWRSDALLLPEGKEKLKQELVKALRRRVPELGVREVYFTDFLVQR